MLVSQRVMNNKNKGNDEFKLSAVNIKSLIGLLRLNH